MRNRLARCVTRCGNALVKRLNGTEAAESALGREPQPLDIAAGVGTKIEKCSDEARSLAWCPTSPLPPSLPPSQRCGRCRVEQDHEVIDVRMDGV